MPELTRRKERSDPTTPVPAIDHIQLRSSGTRQRGHKSGENARVYTFATPVTDEAREIIDFYDPASKYQISKLQRQQGSAPTKSDDGDGEAESDGGLQSVITELSAGAVVKNAAAAIDAVASKLSSGLRGATGAVDLLSGLDVAAQRNVTAPERYSPLGAGERDSAAASSEDVGFSTEAVASDRRDAAAAAVESREPDAQEGGSPTETAASAPTAADAGVEEVVAGDAVPAEVAAAPSPAEARVDGVVVAADVGLGDVSVVEGAEEEPIEPAAGAEGASALLLAAAELAELDADEPLAVEVGMGAIEGADTLAPISTNSAWNADAANSDIIGNAGVTSQLTRSASDISPKAKLSKRIGYRLSLPEDVASEEEGGGDEGSGDEESDEESDEEGNRDESKDDEGNDGEDNGGKEGSGKEGNDKEGSGHKARTPIDKSRNPKSYATLERA
eukprot:GHVU01077964.1.p1 GENE.GHVU01077964.1~~GHVU01077964.1.p1  ORF type:complete len:482 (-),score=106.90 GHVU01077964.1:623-1963(-)